MTDLAEHGGIVKLDDGTGTGATLTDYSSDITSVDVNPTNSSGVYTPINTRYQKANDGGLAYEIMMDVIVGSALDLECAEWMASGGKRTIEVYKPGTGAGALKTTCEVILKSKSQPTRGGSGSAAISKVVLTSHADVTESTVSS